MASIAFFLAERARAQRQGDMGQVRAINADLARLGYVDPKPRPEAVSEPEEPEPMETRPAALPERAVPPRRRRPA